MSWQTSPAATEIEEVVMDWLRQMVGLAPDWSGVVHDTASTATLCALLCARERASGFSQNRAGLQGLAAPLTVYLSNQAHSSVEKAALLAGFGRDNLRFIDTDEVHALRVDLLEQAIAADLVAGCRPCAIVATIGTTGTTAIDPLEAIAKIVDLAGPDTIWLHVDAALAGTAMVLPECRPLWTGVERADSLVFNPHKWMGVGFDLSAYYARDPEHLIRVMSTNPTYLRTAEDGAVTNYRDWQIPLGRRFRALKLWFYLLDVGVEGLQARLRRDLANAQWLKSRSTPPPIGSASPRSLCRPYASATCRRPSPATNRPSPPTTSRSPGASTTAAPPTSPPATSKAARCSASASAPKPPSAGMSKRCGRR